MKRAPANNRMQTDTVKVPAEKTGLNAALYVHIARSEDDEIMDIRISSPGKFDDTTIDRLIGAINDAIQEGIS